jgi:dipeptidyl aminopeptidase/acylaminoacyl peptidase
MVRRFGLVVLTTVVAAAGWSGVAVAKGGGGTIPAPKGLPAFYAVPKKLPSKPGTIIKAQKVKAKGVHGTVYRVMYVSQSQTDKAVAVTGIIVVPKGKAPAGGFPVVTWGHGTNGMADQCAPSINAGASAPSANALLDKGWEFTASDYQGEGTPGLMPYIDGKSAAQDTINIVRAARKLHGSHASSNYVVWGHSEGGQTAMFGLHLGAEYAPELNLKGVVAGAPPSQFNLIFTFLRNSPFRYYLMMAAGGLNAAYGDAAAPVDQVLTPKGVALLPELEKGCSSYLANNFKTITTDSVIKADPFTVPAWKTLLSENDPGTFTTSVAAPLLIIQGGNDEQIPVASTLLLSTHLCGVGQKVERWVYPGQSHAGVIAPSLADMIHWIDDRFGGSAAPGSYKPTGQTDIQITGCPT